MALFSACVYGESGRGKSSLAGKLVKWVRENVLSDAIAKVYTCEHDSAYNELVNDGFVKIWNLNTRQTPFETIDAASQGAWPKDVDDPMSPLVFPDLKKGLGNEIIHIYEGISTFGEFMGGGYALGGLSARAGRGERIGPAEETIKFSDGSKGVGGNARSHYNVVQNAIEGAVKLSHKLPVFNLWTAHEIKSKNDLGYPIVGPEVFGQKQTQYVPRWFANQLHLSINQKTKQTKEGPVLDLEYRMWLKPHFDPALPGIPFIAKNSINIDLQEKVPTSLIGGALALPEFMGLLVEFGQLKLPK